MAASPEFGFNELFAYVIGDIAKAVCDRSGETVQQQFARSQAAVHVILGFLPRDVIEAMLAGHCVMLHETMLASTHDTLFGEAEQMRLGTRSNLVALNKEFNSNLVHLARYQARPAAGRRDLPQVPPAEAMQEASGATLPPEAAGDQRAAPEAANEAPSQADPARSLAQKDFDWMVEHDPEGKLDYRPSPAMLAECQANPAAMAALENGDPAAFAEALGIPIPREAFLEFASMAGSPFDPNAAGPWPKLKTPGPQTD